MRHLRAFTVLYTTARCHDLSMYMHPKTSSSSSISRALCAPRDAGDSDRIPAHAKPRKASMHYLHGYTALYGTPPCPNRVCARVMLGPCQGSQAAVA
jgi:hypothetical protein